MQDKTGFGRLFQNSGSSEFGTINKLTHPFFTIGHSTRSISEFVELLREVKIQLVVDVRTVPRSRANPQFNRDVLPITLSEFAIDYEHSARLGGLRPRSPNVPPSLNSFWENPSFHNYADYATSEEFKSGLMRLRELGHSKRSVIMCAEAMWWRCHRRIIADYLLTSGDEVFHILGRNMVERAHITPAANVASTGALTYPADTSNDLPLLKST
jgi:uncharacterized protein (DUF488 family)